MVLPLVVIARRSSGRRSCSDRARASRNRSATSRSSNLSPFCEGSTASMASSRGRGPSVRDEDEAASASLAAHALLRPYRNVQLRGCWVSTASLAALSSPIGAEMVGIACSCCCCCCCCSCRLTRQATGSQLRVSTPEFSDPTRPQSSQGRLVIRDCPCDVARGIRGDRICASCFARSTYCAARAATARRDGPAVEAMKFEGRPRPVSMSFDTIRRSFCKTSRGVTVLPHTPHAQ